MTTSVLNPWRVIGWGGAAALLCVPLIAMQFTREVQWTGSDFAVMGVLLALVGGGIELLVRAGSGIAYRAGAVLIAVTTLLLIWVNLAVGIIGSEDNPANTLYAGVIALVVGGAIVAHGRARGMVRVAIGAAAAQALVAGIALAGDMGTDGIAWPRDVIGCSALFCTLWLAAAGLYARAAASGPAGQ